MDLTRSLAETQPRRSRDAAETQPRRSRGEPRRSRGEPRGAERSRDAPRCAEMRRDAELCTGASSQPEGSRAGTTPSSRRASSTGRTRITRTRHPPHTHTRTHCSPTRTGPHVECRGVSSHSLLCTGPDQVHGRAPLTDGAAHTGDDTSATRPRHVRDTSRRCSTSAAGTRRATHARAISAASRLSLGCISAASRLHLGRSSCISKRSSARPPRGETGCERRLFTALRCEQASPPRSSRSTSRPPSAASR